MRSVAAVDVSGVLTGTTPACPMAAQVQVHAHQSEHMHYRSFLSANRKI
jgi:hypothetical protein